MMESDPDAQFRQVDWPVFGWKVPGGHAWLTAGPAGHLQPAGHVTAVLLLPTGHHDPAKQFRHVVGAVAPSVAE